MLVIVDHPGYYNLEKNCPTVSLKAILTWTI